MQICCLVVDLPKQINTQKKFIKYKAQLFFLPLLCTESKDCKYLFCFPLLLFGWQKHLFVKCKHSNQVFLHFFMLLIKLKTPHSGDKTLTDDHHHCVYFYFSNYTCVFLTLTLDFACIAYEKQKQRQGKSVVIEFV